LSLEVYIYEYIAWLPCVHFKPFSYNRTHCSESSAVGTTLSASYLIPVNIYDVCPDTIIMKACGQ